MTAAHPLPVDPVLDAIAHAPLGEHDMSAEQAKEFAVIAAAYEAGTLRLVPQDEVPAALEEIARAQAR